MNRVVLIGRLTRDIELRKTQTGTSVGSFTIAVNRRLKQEGQPEADFIRCTAWGKTAEIMSQYLGKGALVGIEGRIQTGSYQDRDGKTVYTTDVVVENFDFLESKAARNVAPTYGSQDQSMSNYAQDQFMGSYNQTSYQQGNTNFTQNQTSSIADTFDNDGLDIASDDLPF